MRFCISRVFAARRKACEFRGGRRIWGFLSWPPIVCALLRHPGQRKARQPDQRVHKPWAPRLVCMCFGSAAKGCAEAVPEVVVGLPSGSAHRYLSGAAALGTTGLFSRRPQWGGPGSSAGTSHSHDSRSSLAELARGRARLDALNVQPTVSLFSSSLPNSMTSMCCKVMEIMSLPWSGTAQLLPSGFLSSSALT